MKRDTDLDLDIDDIDDTAIITKVSATDPGLKNLVTVEMWQNPEFRKTLNIIDLFTVRDPGATPAGPRGGTSMGPGADSVVATPAALAVTTPSANEIFWHGFPSKTAAETPEFKLMSVPPIEKQPWYKFWRVRDVG